MIGHGDISVFTAMHCCYASLVDTAKHPHMNFSELFAISQCTPMSRHCRMVALNVFDLTLGTGSLHSWS